MNEDEQLVALPTQTLLYIRRFSQRGSYYPISIPMLPVNALHYPSSILDNALCYWLLALSLIQEFLSDDLSGISATFSRHSMSSILMRNF